jgi:hypothetical protein
MRILGLFTLLILSFANCNKTTLINTKSIAETPNETSKTHSIILGYYEIGKPNTAFCPEGRISRIEIKRNLKDAIIHILVGGVYSTRTQEVYCE